MDARLDFGGIEVIQKFVKHINSAAAAIGSKSTPPPATLTWC